jgi:hypothetical protein
MRCKATSSKSTHLQTQIALMGEKKQENHIPKSNARSSHTHPQPHPAATVGSRDEGEYRGNHVGEAAPGLLAMWRPAAAGRREPRPCSRRRAGRGRTEERRPRPRPPPLLPCLYVVGQRDLGLDGVAGDEAEGENDAQRRGRRRGCVEEAAALHVPLLPGCGSGRARPCLASCRAGR